MSFCFDTAALCETDPTTPLQYSCCLLQAQLHLPGSFHDQTKLFQLFWLLNRKGEQGLTCKFPPAQEQ